MDSAIGPANDGVEQSGVEGWKHKTTAAKSGRVKWEKSINTLGHAKKGYTG